MHPFVQACHPLLEFSIDFDDIASAYDGAVAIFNLAGSVSAPCRTFFLFVGMGLNNHPTTKLPRTVCAELYENSNRVH